METDKVFFFWASVVMEAMVTERGVGRACANADWGAIDENGVVGGWFWWWGWQWLRRLG